MIIVKSCEAIFDIAIGVRSQLGKPEWVEGVGIRID